MINFGMKQLLRQRGKAILFFLLMAASTALVVTGCVLTIENTRRIQVIEDSYTTIGMVEQMPVTTEPYTQPDPCYGTFSYLSSKYGDKILLEALNFPGADYIQSPEYRPYFISYLPELRHPNGGTLKRHIIEFTPLTESEKGEPVEAKVTKIISSNIDGRSANAREGCTDQNFNEGDTFTLCQHGTQYVYPLKIGERYVSCIYLQGVCPTHGVPEYVSHTGPYSSQSNAEGNLIYKNTFPDDQEEYQSDDPKRRRINHVTGDDFYLEGQPGFNYIKWAEIYKMEDYLFATMPTKSLTLVPSFHDGNINIIEGREITSEEFASGNAVCLIPQQFAMTNQLSIGDRLDLPFMCAYYGDMDGSIPLNLSLLNSEGDFYQPFWEQEYEIVGIYAGGYGTDDIVEDMFIIPEASVRDSWEDNIAWFGTMSKGTVSFEIKNGNIQEFDTAFKKAVPEVENLDIIYDDRGYTEMIKFLNGSRNMALLLLLAGALAELAIIALLLYFFVAKEIKRTAIERSLGMTKHQCRISLLSGVMALTIVAVSLGCMCGALMLDEVRKPPQDTVTTVEDMDRRYIYSMEYSLWAEERILAEETEIDVEKPIEVYWLIPLWICVLILVISLFLVERSFRLDPIYLLSTKGRE